jgi:hypothetical protein
MKLKAKTVECLRLAHIMLCPVCAVLFTFSRQWWIESSMLGSLSGLAALNRGLELVEGVIWDAHDAP